jgi:hypothetical protein
VTSLFDGSRWAALTVAVLLLTACGGHASSTTPPATQKSESKPKPAPTRPPNDTAQLNRLLTARAQAIQTGDVAALVKTATGAQVAKDQRAGAAAKALPISKVQMTAQGTEVDGDRATLRVDMVYAFDKIDTAYLKTSRMTALRTPAGWRIQNDRPSAGTLAPWELTRYKARTSKHFLALAPGSLKVGSLMSDLEKGRARMSHALPGVKPPEHVLVIVARNGDDTRALTKDMRTLRSLVAVAEAQVSTHGPAQRVDAISGQRVFVMWRSYGYRSSDERQMVIAHELTHHALARRTSGRTPPWLTEGIAMYASGDKRASDAGALLSGGRLKDASKQGAAENALSLAKLAKPTALDRMPSVPLAFAYSYASAAAYTIVQKHGKGALLRLFTAFNSEKIRGKPGRKLSDTVVRRTLKTSLKGLEAEINAYARTNTSY